MRYTLTFAIAPLVAVGLAPAGARAQIPPQKPARSLTIERVVDDLYVIAGEGGNVALLVTDAGAVLVDDMFYRNYDGIREQVAAVTGQPIKWVLNTHQHDDHAGGNARMLAIANVIAQDNVRINLSDIKEPYYQDTPGTPIGLPNITFTDELVLHVGGKEVRAQYFGRGHTNGDAVVYFPELKAIHTGDLFLARPGDGAGRRETPADGAGERGGAAAPAAAPAPAAAVAAANGGSAAATPDRPRGVNIYVDYAQGGSFLEWTATLDGILTLDFDTVIPGHGPVATRADLVRFRADLEAMRDRIAGMIRVGATKAQVLAVFETDYGWRSTGCPPSPPTPGCLQFQQMDALIDELTP